jgi:hypothetical protein
MALPCLRPMQRSKLFEITLLGNTECMIQVYILRYVLAHDHASDRRVHNFFGSEQNQHRSDFNHESPELRRYKTQFRASCLHGCLLFCEYVDQVGHTYSRYSRVANVFQ